jgi:endonuclease/exonuclease/phosphatase family metal-dependent hydrolase
MRLQLFILFLLSILSSCRQSDSLTVCSFYTGNDFDKRSTELWEERRSTIESIVGAHNFDIVAMQEVNFDRFISLKEVLPDYHSVIGDGEERTDIEELAPIFFHADKFLLLSKSQFWLSETPDLPGSKNWGALYPRITTWVKLQNKFSGHIFFVFNTHFCHLNEDAQLKSAVLMLQKIHEIAGDAPVIATGNFNVHLNSPVELLLTSNWDWFHSLQNSSRLVKTTKQGRKNQTRAKRFIPSRHTDHILVNSYFDVQAFKPIQSENLETLFTGHRPVYVQLKYLFEPRSRTEERQPYPWTD